VATAGWPRLVQVKASTLQPGTNRVTQSEAHVHGYNIRCAHLRFTHLFLDDEQRVRVGWLDLQNEVPHKRQRAQVEGCAVHPNHELVELLHFKEHTLVENPLKPTRTVNVVQH